MSNRGSTTKKLLASLAILAAVGAFMSFGVFSLFSSTQSNSSTLKTATFGLSQIPSFGDLWDSLTGLLPGDSLTRCLKLTNTSDSPVTIDAAPSLTDGLSASATLSLSEVSGIKTNGADPTADIKACTPSGTSLTTVKTYLTDASGSGLTTQHLLKTGGTDTSSLADTTWAGGEFHFYKVVVKVPTGLLATGITPDTNKSIAPAVSFTATQAAGSAK